MSAAIVVVLILLAIGIVADSLLRLRRWLQKPPPGPSAQAPSDDDAA
ncbi:MAG TPA: hypothetical protein VEI45_11785 [Mycobacterium sp.]|nr:hypothetical protein [Mycobacterium sp.]